jgi:hypothetical protein
MDTSAGGQAAAWAIAARPLAAAHMRACRLAHWLCAQPDGGTAVLAELLPACLDRWRLV